MIVWIYDDNYYFLKVYSKNLIISIKEALLLYFKAIFQPSLFKLTIVLNVQLMFKIAIKIKNVYYKKRYINWNQKFTSNTILFQK